MFNVRVWLVALGLASIAGSCLGGADDIASIQEGLDAMKKNDLPGGYAKLTEKAGEDKIYAQLGNAYALLLEGKYSAADSALQKAEGLAGDDAALASEIKLRRALVALRAGDLDGVKTHGKGSGEAAGLVMAAEVHLADLEQDDAVALLNEAREKGKGPVKQTAEKYLELLQSGSQAQASLAEATALWAIGQRGDAVDSAEGPLRDLPEDDTKAATLLLWAGRAVAAGRPDAADSILASIGFPPEGQQWRLNATRAMVQAARGDCEGAKGVFDVLAIAGAPADGLADARATAAALCTDKDAAKSLVDGMESAAAARSLLEAGARPAAKGAYSDGAFGAFLGSQ